MWMKRSSLMTFNKVWSLSTVFGKRRRDPRLGIKDRACRSHARRELRPLAFGFAAVGANSTRGLTPAIAVEITLVYLEQIPQTAWSRS